jgi:hypothetical protein
LAPIGTDPAGCGRPAGGGGTGEAFGAAIWGAGGSIGAGAGDPMGMKPWDGGTWPNRGRAAPPFTTGTGCPGAALLGPRPPNGVPLKMLSMAFS